MNTKVSLYTRDSGGYRKTDPRGIYPADRTTFVLRYVGDDMKRVWETLPKNTNFATARKLCLQKELWLGDPVAQTPSIKREPAKAAVPTGDGRIRIADAIEKYIDQCWAENNHVAKTVKVKAQELGRFAEFCRVERKKEHVADLNRADMLAYRDWMFKDRYMPWTVTGDLMGVTTMLKRNPLLSVKGLLKSEGVSTTDLIISKRITREPREYSKASLIAIVAQQLYGSGVKLRPGQTVEYVITDADNPVPNDRARAYALWEGWQGYDREKYQAMLLEAFEPFEQPLRSGDKICECGSPRS